MHLPRLLGLAALTALATAFLVAPTISLAATPSYDSRDGACTGTEGVTVIVDLNPTNDSTPAAPVHVRCVFGTPDSGLDALDRAGFEYTTSDAFGDPFVCVIEGLPAACDPFGAGYWSYWKQSGTAWTFYDVGGFLARPQPGSVEGWRWVGNWETDPSDPPRVSPYAVRITAAPSTVTTGTTATFTFAVADAPDTTVLCRVDNGFWSACTSGTTHGVSGSTVGTHTFAVRALDEFGNATIASEQYAVVAPTPAAPIVTAATLGAPTAAATSAHTATVAATVSAGTADQAVHVEFTSGTDRAAATRTAATSVAAGATVAPTFAIAGLASNTSFSYRVVTTGSVGVVASEWATFTTPRVARRLKVTTPDRFVARGERVAVRVERLGAGEKVTVALGETRLGTATADEDGEATITVRIPARFELGSDSLVAIGSGSDRTGRTGVVVTAAAKLRVAASDTTVAPRARPRITVQGLVAFEPVTLRWRGNVVAEGTATRTGSFTALVPVGVRPGTYELIAIGSHATRAGSVSIFVAAATSRRRG